MQTVADWKLSVPARPRELRSSAAIPESGSLWFCGGAEPAGWLPTGRHLYHLGHWYTEFSRPAILEWEEAA